MGLKMQKIAVLIPCYNEELTIAKVVQDFKKALPEAEIFVFDNNSTDNTKEKALKAGAKVFFEKNRGKGNVVRRMFREVDADVYVLVDGDDTYPAEEVRKLIEPVIDKKADMVVGSRLERSEKGAFRKFHKFGNRLITGLINLLFKTSLTDVLSGYRAFSKTFAKGVVLVSKGFEIETEMTLRCIEVGLSIEEVPISYRSRPKGSKSKLSTFMDGFLIVSTIFNIFKDYRPFLFFSIISLFLFLLGLLFGVPVIVEYLETGYVFKLPSAVLAASLEVLSFMFFCSGIVMDSIKNFRALVQEKWLKEIK